MLIDDDDDDDDDVPLSPSSILWYKPMGGTAVMPCGWEDNRRSGVALAMRHRH